MTDLERQALHALVNCSMRPGSHGKRFRNDMESALAANSEFQLTDNQALLLWSLVYTYRRQIKDYVLVKHGEHVHNTETLPDIYQPGDHREPARKTKRPVRLKSSRYRLELEKGGGRLKL